MTAHHTFIILQQAVSEIDALDTDQQKELAHKLEEIYREPSKAHHREWLQKLHELLDID